MNHWCFRKIFFVPTLMMTLVGCVSVNIGSSKSEKSKVVEYKEPKDPFVSIKTDGADKSWLNKKTGNTIAYLSECNIQNEKQLKNIETETLSILTEPKIISSAQSEFNNRESLTTVAEGTVDGVAVKLKTVIFNKNNCSYSLTFGGLKSKYEIDLKYFEQFLEEFKVP